MSSHKNNASKPAKKRSGGTPRFARKNKPSFKSKPSVRPAGARPQAKRVIKKFDPSLFIKKVEECTSSVVEHLQSSFNDFALEPQLKENIALKGYVNPTPIQDQAIPLILEGRDILATANTGTGKTAAFLIPLINNALTKQTQRVLIVTPTRELAGQIKDELDALRLNTDLSSLVCIGGLNINFQKSHLKKKPTFVVGTPGRLLDLEKNKAINFNHFTSIVLDEVDTMLDMGFINDMRYIISKLPKKRHALFFSATLPQKTQIIDSFLTNPASVNVKTRQSAENVNQDVVKVDVTQKLEKLHDLLIKPEFKKVIVFLRTKGNTERLTKKLKTRGFAVATIHGNKTQAQRKKALLSFKKDAVSILLATDVVARGIDIHNVSHVINYDLPQTYEDYIHRIGRTGRASKVGQAITFVE